MIIVYITCSGPEEAKNIAQALVNAKLAACANYFPIKSLYKWEGEMKNDDETVLLVKSEDSKFNEIKKKVIAIHSCKLPCILKFNAEANNQFEKWVGDQVN